MTMTDTIAAVLKTITGGRMNPIGTLIEIPGMDAVSQRVCKGGGYLTTLSYQ